MTNNQKIIKYSAIALATILTIGILGSLAAAAYGASFLFSKNNPDNNYIASTQTAAQGDMNFHETFSDVKSLYIINGFGELSIETADTDCITVNGRNVTDKFTCTLNGNTLTLRDEDSNKNYWLRSFKATDTHPVISITVPKDFLADSIHITNGAGIISAYDLKTDSLKMETGAGKIEFNRTEANSVKLEGGVGTTDFIDCAFRDFTMDCGVGVTSYSGTLLGDNKITCGVGSITLNLTGNYEDYDIDLQTGLGKISVNGSDYLSSARLNKGAPNRLRIEGGVGSMDISIR